MNGLKRYYIFGAILIFIYLLAQYFKPKPTDWSSSYLSKDKIPFGTYILHQRILDLFPGSELQMAKSAPYNNLKESANGSSNYLLIASTLKVDSLDFKEMVKYMEKGNQIFIAAQEIRGILADTLKIAIDVDFNFQNRRKFPINFVNPTLVKEYDYYFDKGIGERYFSKLDSARAIVLGRKEQAKANFICYKFGKGTLYILPNPQLLTNYSLLREDGLDYATKALSYLPNASRLIWDEHFNKPAGQNDSVLRVFFEYEQLRWAYYIALFSLVGFVLFEIKRRQRIIPIAEIQKNTSVEFVKVVGRVYYQQRNNRDIAEKKVTYLLSYIRNRYRLKTTTIDEEFKAKLVNVSGAKAEVIEELLMKIAQLKAGQMVNDKVLIDLNKIIEEFYKQDQ